MAQANVSLAPNNSRSAATDCECEFELRVERRERDLCEVEPDADADERRRRRCKRRRRRRGFSSAIANVLLDKTRAQRRLTQIVAERFHNHRLMGVAVDLFHGL